MSDFINLLKEYQEDYDRLDNILSHLMKINDSCEGDGCDMLYSRLGLFFHLLTLHRRGSKCFENPEQVYNTAFFGGLVNQSPNPQNKRTYVIDHVVKRAIHDLNSNISTFRQHLNFLYGLIFIAGKINIFESMLEGNEKSSSSESSTAYLTVHYILDDLKEKKAFLISNSHTHFRTSNKNLNSFLEKRYDELIDFLTEKVKEWKPTIKIDLCEGLIQLQMSGPSQAAVGSIIITDMEEDTLCIEDCRGVCKNMEMRKERLIFNYIILGSPIYLRGEKEVISGIKKGSILIQVPGGLCFDVYKYMEYPPIMTNGTSIPSSPGQEVQKPEPMELKFGTACSEEALNKLINEFKNFFKRYGFSSNLIHNPPTTILKCEKDGREISLHCDQELLVIKYDDHAQCKKSLREFLEKFNTHFHSGTIQRYKNSLTGGTQ